MKLSNRVLLISLSFAALPVARAQDSKPNIILILADDMGFECVGANGGASYRTPRLDALAGEGIRSTQCYSQPICTPSRVQLMTGRYNNRNYQGFGYLDVNEISFASLLKSAGYATCIAGKWQLNAPNREPGGFPGEERPYHFGFDEYCLWQLTERGSRYVNPTIMQNKVRIDGLESSYGPDVFQKFVLGFMERYKNRPFFIYYPLVLPHAPFVPTPDCPDWSQRLSDNPEQEKAERDEFLGNTEYFDGMVAYVDKIVGQLVDRVNDLGLSHNTLIIFTGDNGTHTRIISKMRDGSEIKGGKGKMTDAGTHVPLIMCWKGVTPRGKVSADLVDFSDFLATFCELAGATPPSDRRMDGISLVPILNGKEGKRKWVFSHYWGNKGTTKEGTREFIRDERFKVYDNGECYDTVSDPLEENPLRVENLPSSERNRVDSLAANLKQFE